MPTLGLRGRPFLVFATALTAVIFAATPIRFGESRAHAPPDVSCPRFGRAAGITDLLRTVPRDQRPLVPRAAGDSSLDVRIVDPPPPNGPQLRRAPHVEALLRVFGSPGLGDGLRA